jgi:4a-hydroxytetrahydrobiopterin dehydratase
MATTALNEAEIIEGLARLKNWERHGDKLVKIFKVDTYMTGLAFAAAIGTVAEGFNHHPDMLIGYKKVTVEFTTHDAGNKLSAKDFAVAAAIDALNYPKS